jgi:aminoglycoside phosphotransferase (APT) family kinase protein
MDRLMKWLPENIPDDDTSCIVHGDYRLDNLVLAPDEARVSAVLDWELSTLGHPLADLAHGCAHYYISIANQPPLTDADANTKANTAANTAANTGANGEGGADETVRSDRASTDGESVDGISDVAGAESGIPTESEYVETYCRFTGRSGVPHWNFYLAFVIFRYAGIAQGVYKRGLQGNASSQEAMSLGDIVEIASDKAWEISQRPEIDS